MTRLALQPSEAAIAVAGVGSREWVAVTFLFPALDADALALISNRTPLHVSRVYTYMRIRGRRPTRRPNGVCLDWVLKTGLFSAPTLRFWETCGYQEVLPMSRVEAGPSGTIRLFEKYILSAAFPSYHSSCTHHVEND